MSVSIDAERPPVEVEADILKFLRNTDQAPNSQNLARIKGLLRRTSESAYQLLMNCTEENFDEVDNARLASEEAAIPSKLAHGAYRAGVFRALAEVRAQ